ncbi:hypothetical protein PV328_006601 [Microctonus aethiopoides]|uniref:C2H2-type domain-containing protein n=1 Tax=Microctonus aethiopoides TaxID=144406 RepID=A0AA39KTQ1_9HYME|nr:hypothetical protein PV328_006601 [Microctonus aethiopoides]
MNEACPNCGQLTNSSSSRLINDNCGHQKCRMCLLYEENGCKTCEIEQKKLPITNNIGSDLFDHVEINQAETESLPSPILLDISNPNYSDIINNVKSPLKIELPINNSDVTKSQTNISCIPIVDAKINNNTLVTNSIDDNDKVKSKKFMDRSHIITLPGVPEKFKCTACGKIFKNKKGKCYHDGCVTGILPYHCSICDRSFVKKSHFEYHERVHRDYRPFKCELCNKAFAQKNKLNRHMVSHSKEKPFLCPNCGKCYKKKDDLKSHMTVHTGLMPYVCESCGKKFRMRTNLNRHMKSHSNERPHVCDTCGKSFKDKTLLARHKRIHAKERPYSCAHCPRVFISKSELCRHLAIHTDGKPFSCTICQTEFRRKDNLNRHVRHHHSEEQQAAQDGLTESKTTKKNSNNMKIKKVKRNTAVKTKLISKKVSQIKRSVSQKNSSTNTTLNTNLRVQLNSQIDSRRNTTPVIRAPGELSNAVPVINGPISSILKRDEKSDTKKKVWTYTEPIPRAAAVVINQRIEEKLYSQITPSNCRFYGDNSSRIDSYVPYSIVHNPVKAVPIGCISNERRMSDSNFYPPKSDTLIELKSTILPSNVYHQNNIIRDNEMQIEEKTKQKCTIVMDEKVNVCFRNNNINRGATIEGTNCVSTIKKI